MLLLVWIKSLTTVYDSPAAEYSCGQTIPWQYEDRLNPATFVETPLFQCLQKPPNCSANNYYRDEGGIFEQIGLEGVSAEKRSMLMLLLLSYKIPAPRVGGMLGKSHEG